MDTIDNEALNVILERIEAKIEDTVSKKVEEIVNRVKKSTSDDSMYSVKEAAEYLGCSIRTVHYYKNNGQLKFYKKGGAIRFKLEDLQDFIKKGRCKLPRII